MRERRSTFHNRFRRRFSVGDRLAMWTGGAYTYNAEGTVAVTSKPVATASKS